MLSEEEILMSYEDSICPFCGYELVDTAIFCYPYGGYIFDCDGYSDGECSYCLHKYREHDHDVYLCPQCYKGYNVKSKKPITDLFLYSVDPGHAFNYNIGKSKELLIQFPDQSIIMAVAAMEVYFHDKFVSIINSNSKYEINRSLSKNSSFQNLGIVNESYKKAFSFEIEIILNRIDPDLFERIKRIIAVRNIIIHNAGRIDKKSISILKMYKDEHIDLSIQINKENAGKSIECIENAVNEIEKEIDFKFKIYQNIRLSL